LTPPCGHETPKLKNCFYCAWAKSHPGKEPPRPKPPSSISLPCVHLGGELTGAERNAAGLSHTKRWATCGHAAKPLGEYVCPCSGCGPNCAGYSLPRREPPTVRNLLYHVYPVRGNVMW
jgi:hypothetical protein